MHSDINFQSNKKSSDQHLILLIHPDGSIQLDSSIPSEEASALFFRFLELCRVISEEPELALEIFDLPREGAQLR